VPRLERSKFVGPAERCSNFMEYPQTA